MLFPRTRLMRTFPAVLFLLMLTSVTFARDYVVPDEPLNVVYEGVEQFGQVALSADGRFVAVSSIVDGHVYVHDRQSSTTERVSVDSQGEPLTTAEGGLSVSISDDGRYVVFPIFATEFGDGVLYLRDRHTGNTQNIGKDELGQPITWTSVVHAVITGDGRYIAYWGLNEAEPCENFNGCGSIYVYDQKTQKREMVSVNNHGIPADNANAFASISDNGRYVAFLSDATNLGVPPTQVCEETHEYSFNCSHLYLHDRQKQTTTYIPLPNDWTETQLITSAILLGFEISGNGRYIVYSYLREGESPQPYVTYIYDVLTETTEIIELDSPDEGTHRLGLNVISDDGRFIVMGKNADNMIYVYDRVIGMATPITDSSVQPIPRKPFIGVTAPPALSISGDGSTIVFFIDDGSISSGTNHLAHGQAFSPAPYSEVELVKNGGAETQGVMTKMAEDWQVTDYRAGRRRCDYFPHTDSCVFQIKPVTGKIARFTQSVPAVNNPGDVLKFSAYVRGFNVSRATVRVLVNYADGTSEFVKIPSAQLNGTYNYKQVTAMMTLDKLASSIKVQMYIHYRGTGKLLVDDVSLMMGNGVPGGFEIPPLPNTPTPDGSLLPGRITY